MSNEPKAGPGLDPELLAAYIDQRLSPEQRAAVEAQLAADPDSYAVLVETLKAIDSADAKVPEVPRGRVPKVWWAIAGGVLAAAAAIALVVWTQPDLLRRLRGDDIDAGLARLIAAVGDERLVEARLTGGFHHGPLRSPMRRNSASPSQQNLELLAAAGALQRAAESVASSENLHHWGLAQLQLGAYDGAVTTLQRAAEGVDVSARVRADLAAALIARSASGATKDLADAVAILRELSELPEPPNEALFNEALALERLGILDAAIDAWRRAISAEPEGSPWRAEAQAHLTVLLEQRKISRDSEWQSHRRRLLAGDTTLVPDVPTRFAQESRELLEDVLIAQFAQACFPVTARDCASLKSITQALADHRATLGDRLSLDAILRLEELARQNPRLASRLVDAHVLYSTARQQFEGADPASSGPQFTNAAKMFVELGSPFEFWCRNYALSSEYFSARHDIARAGADRLLNDLHGGPYPIVEARTHWLKGLVTFVQGDFEQALADYGSAITAYESAGESGNATFLVALRGEVESYVGSVELAWRDRIGSVGRVDAINNVRRRHSILLSGSLFSLRSGNPVLAELLADAAVRNARGSNNAILGAEAALYRARSLQAGDRHREAEAALNSAWTSLEGAPAAIATRLRAEVMLTASEVLAHAGNLQPQLADQASVFLKGLGVEFRLPAVERVRARLALSAGNLSAARESYRLALELSAAQRDRLLREHRLSFVDESWDLIDEAAAVERRAGASVTDTLAFVEGHVGERSAPVPLLARTAMMRFLVLPRETLIVFATSEGVSELAVDIDRRSVQTLADRFERTVRGGADEDGAGRELWSRLFGPLADRLREVDTLYLVPDGPLYRVPFAALPDDRREPLLKRTAIVITPRRSSAPRTAETRTHDRQLFVIAQDAPAQGSALAALPDARAEVAELSKLYPKAIVATGATPLDRLVTIAEQSTLLHFAGHAEANAMYPENSWLHVGGGKDRLFAHEIQTWRLPSNAIVILAACETSQGRVSRTEGAASLAKAFLAAGASSVIATSWQVPDREARLMSRELHHHLRSGLTPARALRQAQLARIAAGDPPSVWLAFGVFERSVPQNINTN